jgi:DNA-binding transcriptional regulator YhcF (GntR family)
VILSVDLESALPPYEQIRAQITAMTASGVLPPGTRLPTIRQLSADLGLAPGTVSRAYRELDVAGVISARGRHGTYIARPPTLTPDERASRLRLAAASYAQAARLLGASQRETVLVLREALATSGRTQ